MVFTSYLFVFYFLPLVLAGYYALPALPAWRNVWLLLASWVFYGWAEPRFLLLMLAVTAVTFLAGKAIAQAPAESPRRKAMLTGAVVACLGALGFFKYFDFALTNLGALSHALGGPTWSAWGIVLPVGVSFYTFQALSYCVDVYRGDARPARSLSDFACYVALFPQLVAGPIVRYAQVAGQLVERRENAAQFASGITLFILGFAKKVLLANPLGTVADAAFGAQSLDAAGAWFGVVAYALQIYFDFCGYSDMAVGLGRMFGFEFMKNFDAPYRAESITDFWRRWHISLSTFLRDYLYIPLGGNRGGAARTYVNLAIVMLLGGLWHGANWTFIVWGAWHGGLLIAERWAGKKPAYQRLPRALRVAATFVLVLGSWVWFRAATLGDALVYFRAMLGGGESSEVTALLAGQLFAPGKLAVMAVAVCFLFARRQAHDWSESLTWPKVAVVLPLFALSLLVMFSQSSNPFLYFQF
jgi:alginate O-acetyltransferase complex protein AlgI